MSHFHLFAYGSLRAGGSAAGMLEGCTRVGTGTLQGTLYDVEGQYPALMLYGQTPVPGDIWRCPADMLLRLDEYEGVAGSLFRRIAQEVVDDATGETFPCWLYVAGPALSRKLTPDHRVSTAR